MKAFTRSLQPRLTIAFTVCCRFLFYRFLGILSSRHSQATPQKTIPQMSVAHLKQLLQEDRHRFLLIDVRFPQEYEAGHISGAMLVPLTEIQQGTGIERIWQTLTDRWQAGFITDPRLIVVCTAGVRSAKAVRLLEEAGLPGVNLLGGMQSWQASTQKQKFPSLLSRQTQNFASPLNS
ncbi:MAG: rhodanese-like domain-containing protein [Leptolyngbyaceae cyanobacterium bins.59]|nr:rhodanese-like domain-containing protein [Leptolyngbyaceae cyanobacterium bins.59]